MRQLSINIQVFKQIIYTLNFLLAGMPNYLWSLDMRQYDGGGVRVERESNLVLVKVEYFQSHITKT